MNTVSTAMLEYNTTLFSESAETESSTETTLSEYMPDIHRIVRVDARPVMSAARAEEGVAVIEGWVDCVVMYLPPEGSLQSHFCRLPYVLQRRDERVGNATRISSSVAINSVTCRPLSERKMAVSCMVRGVIQAEESKTEQIVSPSDEDREKAEFLQSDHMAAKFVDKTDKNFSIEEMLELPAGSPHIERMLRCDASLRTLEYKVVTNRTVIKGEAVVSCLYLSDIETGRVDHYNTRIPFNEVVDNESAREGDIASISYNITDIIYGVMADASGEDRQLSLRIDVRATVAVYTMVTIPIIHDAYSAGNHLRITSSDLDTENLWEYRCTEKLNESVPLESGMTDIFSVEVYADVRGAKVVDGVPLFSGALLVSLLTRDESGEIEAVDRSIKFTSTCEQGRGAVTPDTVFTGNCFVESFDWRIGVSGELNISALIACTGIGRMKAPVTTVSTMEIGERVERQGNPGTVTLYYPTEGESLWDVGKRYRVPIEAVRGANGMEVDERVRQGPMIIPR